MPETLSPWDGRVGPPEFEVYSEKYKDYFVMTRRDGIIEVRLHTDGGPFQHSWTGHNAWNQVWQEVGRDPENEVLIITGTGDRWHTGSADLWNAPFKEWSTDSQIKMYYDMIKLLESLIFCVDIPTIGAINGPGTHCEIATVCDISLCTDDADFFDPHFLMGAAPGDGMALTLQQTIGIKRASYCAYTGQRIDGPTALELGLVNEVLPRERLLARAWELAEMIMQRPRITRRMTHAILSRPWKRALADDIGFHVTHQLYDMVLSHGESALARFEENKDRFTGAPDETG